MNKKDQQANKNKLHPIIRGVIIGGSLGFIATWFGILHPLHALVLGILAGFLAGLTSNISQKYKGKK